MLDNTLKTQLQSYMGMISQPVQIVACLDDGAKSRELRDLLQQIQQMSDHITFTERNDEDHRKPSFSINRPDGSISLRFAGIPLGHEFTSLVLALLQAGGHPIKIDEDVIQHGYITLRSTVLCSKRRSIVAKLCLSLAFT